MKNAKQIRKMMPAKKHMIEKCLTHIENLIKDRASKNNDSIYIKIVDIKHLEICINDVIEILGWLGFRVTLKEECCALTIRW